jgi:hypothetical protein
MTDYELPEAWGVMTDEARSAWFTQERARRQAMRQTAVFGGVGNE